MSKQFLVINQQVDGLPDLLIPLDRIVHIKEFDPTGGCDLRKRETRVYYEDPHEPGKIAVVQEDQPVHELLNQVFTMDASATLKTYTKAWNERLLKQLNVNLDKETDQ